ncbi:DUF3558 domain-containing protein [Actinophytocola sp. NPDC049390]|uniref:DUF3558 domain-containing protein n=1 Tax=Actinophytocola sp. NPDC049390 TaxID=3363894 RepID=UPI00378B2012
MVLAAAATGCTQTSVGQPRPVESSSPSRPRDVDLTGKDPCALVPEADLSAFDIDKTGKPDRNKDFDSPECYYSGNDHGYWVTLVTNNGIYVWLDGTYNAEVDEDDPVEGFAAFTVAADVPQNRCDVVVDVADGQYLMTTVLPDLPEVAFSESCELAHELAESAVSGLGE